MVEWKEIGNCCKTLPPPKKLEKELYEAEGLYSIIDQGQKDVVGYTDDESALVPFGEYVLFGDHTRYIKYYKGRFAQGADGLKILIAKDSINPRYFYYAFSNTDVPSRGYSRHWSIAKELLIPIPSLAEQERIVGILDTFTASIENLKEQIAQRRKQYEHYRDQLLDLEGKPGVEMKTLGEVCKIGDGLHGTPVYKDNGEYFFINGNNFCDGRIILKSDTKRVDETMFVKYGISLDKETILMSINGTIGNIAIYNNEKVILGKSAAYFKIIKRDVVCFRYIYYLLQTSFSKEYYSLSLTGSTIKNLGLKALREYVISIPTLQEQERIVSILDTFEASIQNLEAQLAERQKQYEYYRNKLLTFGE